MRVCHETKGRSGKTMIIISGLPLADDTLKELTNALKRHCDAGNSLEGNVVEIRGEYVEPLIDELFKCGFKTKESGG